MRSRAPRLTLIATVATLLAVGCSNSDEATYHGRVQFNGQPVRNGAVYFVPLPNGTPLGAVIENGRYRVTVPVGGHYRVDVVGFGGLDGVTSSAELAAQAEQRAVAPPVTEIPLDATGNGTQIECVPGTHQMDLSLQTR